MSSISPDRMAKIDAMVVDITTRARPVLQSIPKGKRDGIVREMDAGFERAYAVMLGQPGPRSEEAVLIVEKIREGLTRLCDEL